GWQQPCYLLGEGYVSSFAELMRSTAWENYGRASGNPKCRDCMVHCGYEPSAVAATFGSLRGFLRTVRLVLWGSKPSKEDHPPTGQVPAPHVGQARSRELAELPVLR